MKRILLDQGLAPAAATLLRAAGWDVIHVSEAGLDTAEDPEILEFARQNRWRKQVAPR
jgi:predicted nuclease of predicted toxin-antitoxin system